MSLFESDDNTAFFSDLSRENSYFTSKMVTTRFSDTQWNQIMEAWRIFDTDGDGLVTVQDLRTLMLSFGYDHSEKASKSQCFCRQPTIQQLAVDAHVVITRSHRVI